MEFALLGVCGKYIDCSGGPHILNEAHIVEKGSMNSFLSGKNYERSKRAHFLLALAFEILHFQSFLSSQDENYDQLLNDISFDSDYNSLPENIKQLFQDTKNL